MAFRQSVRLLRTPPRQGHYRFYSNNSNSNTQSSYKYATSAAIVAASSAIYVAYKNNEPVYAASISEHVPAWNGMQFELYMYYGCPFCSKLESYLKYRQIPYKRIEVNAMTKGEVKAAGKPFGNYKKVPFVIATVEETGEKIPLKDSSRILSILESFSLAGDKSTEHLKFLSEQCYAEFTQVEENAKGKKTETVDFQNKRHVMYAGAAESVVVPSKKFLENQIKWRQWVEDKLLHTIAPNLYRTYSEALTSTAHFTNISPRFHGTWTGSSINYIGGTAMKVIGDMVKKRHNISENPRDDLYKYCNQWAKALPESGFMSGLNEPGVADLEAFGVLVILEGTPVFPDMMGNSRIGPWYNRMRARIADKQSIKPSEHCFLVPAE